MGVTLRHICKILPMAVCICLLSAMPARARFQNVIPRYDVADSLLSSGVSSFETGKYEIAQALFDRVLNEFEPNNATTTAIILAAKSAYRLGKFESARAYISGFAGKYGSSKYVSEARFLDQLSFDASRFMARKTTSLGIIFSLDRDESGQTQEIFNGVRLAVDQYNLEHSEQPVQMIFRDIDGGAASARRAIRELAAEGVSVIIGTLFSEEAIAAAEEAELLQKVFVAPLATNDQLVDNRSFTFQANPSMKVRGAAMARFAVNGLRLDSIAVILATDDRQISERQSDGFLEEASQLGVTINMVSVLPNENALYRLSDALGADTLDLAKAVYIPLASRSPAATAGAILSNLDRMNPNIRVIGNEGWQDLPQVSHASSYLVTYGNEFWVDPASDQYQAFARTFRALAMAEPGRLGVTGFDVTNFVLNVLDQLESKDGLNRQKELRLVEAFRAQPLFQGLGLRIHFDGSNVNRALFYHRYKDNELTLIR